MGLNYSVADAANTMNIGLYAMAWWGKLSRNECVGKIPKPSPITPVQIEICELKKKAT